MIMLNVELKIGTTTHFITSWSARHESQLLGGGVPSFWLFFFVFLRQNENDR